MAVTRLVCPHCGHDGTPETSRPPLGSHGFNYLAEGLLCREVRGYDETGRLWFSGEIRGEASQTANARIECRSCWRTFPVPKGLVCATLAEEPPGRSAAPPAQRKPSPAGEEGPDLTVEVVDQRLASTVRNAVEDAQRPINLHIAKLEAGVAGLSRAVEDIASLKADVAAVQYQIASLSPAWRRALQAAATPGQAAAGIAEQVADLRQTVAGLAADVKERAEALDAAHREAGHARSRLGEVIAQLEVGEQAIRQRLDAQADVIRGLHAATQEQVARLEELRAAVQRLEGTVSALSKAKPLPEEL